MEIEFWQQRWLDDQTGFHLDQVNPYLADYWSALNLSSNSTVLVPMCGKSLDMRWLVAQKYKILGVECSEKAVEEFFAEQNIKQQVDSYKNYSRHRSDNYKLLLGDFFKLDKEMLSEVSAVYDRASLVALPEQMRKQYVELLVNELPDTVTMLLVTVDYKQSLMTGPPFSITDEEVQSLYSDHFKIEILHQKDVIEEQQRFKDRGLDYMIERVYKIGR